MAADSLSQMTGRKEADITVHQSVEKITEIRGKPIAVMISGIGELNRRTIISLIREFEFELIKRGTLRDLDVSSFCFALDGLYAEALREGISAAATRECPEGIRKRERATRRARDGGRTLGGRTRPCHRRILAWQVLSGDHRDIATGSFIYHRYAESEISRGVRLYNAWGYTTAIDRILHGFDSKELYKNLRALELIEQIRRDDPERLAKLAPEVQALPAPPPTLLRDLDQFSSLMEMRHRLRGMPLQEAVEFAEYLGNVAIGYDRFYEGTSRVGGALDVVAMQPEGVHWYKRKQFLRDMATARDMARQHAEREALRLQLEGFSSIAPAEDDKEDPGDDLEGGTSSSIGAEQ